jgi:protein TonB
MRSELERLASLQKVYHSRTNRYAVEAEILGFEAPELMSLGLSVSPTGYFVVATHELLGPAFGCAAFYGLMDPPLFPVRPERRGEVSCTTEGPPTPLTTLPAEIPRDPAFTPYTVAPEVLNPDEVLRALERDYPPLLRDSRRGGTVRVWILIDEDGLIRRTTLSQSSGYLALDQAALRVATTIQFSPAVLDDKPVSVWISYPITFTTRD